MALDKKVSKLKIKVLANKFKCLKTFFSKLITCGGYRDSK